MPETNSRSGEPRQRLGRGLAALLGETKASAEEAAVGQGVKQIPIEFIRSSVRNPRQVFHEKELEELAASIREKGIIQPIVVRPVSGVSDAYEIVAGERRWRAAQRAGLHTVPVIALQLSDREAVEISIVENVQRSDLNALEEARGFSMLASEFGYSQADIGRILGKSRSHVANTLRLLALPEHARNMLASGAISAGHGRALLSVPDPNSVADRIVAQDLSVRDVEKMSEGEKLTPAETKVKVEADPATRDLENRLSLSIGAHIVIHNTKRLKEIKIRFKDYDQLEHLCEKLLKQ